MNNSNLTMFIQRGLQVSVDDSSRSGLRAPRGNRARWLHILLNCHGRSRTEAAPITCIDRHVDHAKTVSILSRPRVVVVDIAAYSGGALSILKDFTDYLALQDGQA